MRAQLQEIQEETGHFYNLEATPAEGTSYRLAKLDRERYPDILTAGENVYYYTNSSQLPVGFTDDIFETLDLQDDLQSLYTGGTVLHLYMGERISDIEVAKKLIRKAFTNYKLPYISLTPTFSICPGTWLYCRRTLYLSGMRPRCRGLEPGRRLSAADPELS